ncbi:MAG: hypothetical protein IT323_20740 [Anaerolineae bacterium]|nr:hypothetical protein [Anaerolineae bacterium]
MPDLIFTAAEEVGDGNVPRSVLVKMDGLSGKLSEFYVHDYRESGLYALRWSPGGDLLAIAIESPSQPADDMPYWWVEAALCILSRSGALQMCMNAPLAPQSYMWDGNISSTAFPMSWSDDGKVVYFLTSTLDAPFTLALVEADVASGQTLRTLYQYEPTAEETPWMAWSSDREALLVGLEMPTAATTSLIHLDSDVRLEMGDIVGIDSYICREFSPQGALFAAIARDGSTILVRQDGQIAHVIPPITGAVFASFSCPAWWSDEQTVYLHGRRTDTSREAIARYSLAQRALIDIIYSFPSDSGAYSGPLAVSPDGQFVAFESFDNPIMPGAPVVEVVSKERSARRLLGPYVYTYSPLWEPEQVPQN